MDTKKTPRPLLTNQPHCCHYLHHNKPLSAVSGRPTTAHHTTPHTQQGSPHHKPTHPLRLLVLSCLSLSLVHSYSTGFTQGPSPYLPRKRKPRVRAPRDTPHASHTHLRTASALPWHAPHPPLAASAFPWRASPLASTHRSRHSEALPPFGGNACDALIIIIIIPHPPPLLPQ